MSASGVVNQDAAELEAAEIAAAASRESEDFAAERDAQVVRFVKTSHDYYRAQFARIGGHAACGTGGSVS